MNAVLTPTAVHHERPIVSVAFLADPYPSYRALREAGPIHWREEFFGGAWLLSRHADVEAVLCAADQGDLRGEAELLAQFTQAPKKRKATWPTYGSVQRRLQGKAQQSQLKASRRLKPE
jgi:cytochrome P450